MDSPALILPQWPSLHRLIPSHFPPIDLFETVANPEELALVFAIEALTNDRLKEQVGDLYRVPAHERVSGPDSTPVMAAFTHIAFSSRFTDGSYGIYYGANSQQTAVAETVFHREFFLSQTNEPDTQLTMREYINQVALPLHDIRADHYQHLHQPDSYHQPQAFAQQLRAQGSNGLLYPSVRRTGGECIAAFKPKAVTLPVQGQHFRYIWCARQQKVTSVLLQLEVDF
ncbi:MAG: hypothetical protein ACI8WB_000126 [Phenylobacterium sp.]|jgi:hypothetical protein